MTIPTRRALAALTTTLLLGAGLAAPATAAPETVRLDPATAPAGPAPRGAWLDVPAQVIHDGDRTVRVRPRIPAPLARVTEAAGGWVAWVDEVNEYRIVHIAEDGTHRTLARRSSKPYRDLLSSFAVSPDGKRLAYTWQDDDARYATVVRVADGRKVATIAGDQADVLDFHGGKVWLQWDSEGRERQTRLATWKPGGGVDELGERYTHITGVDAAGGLAWRDDNFYGPSLRVVSLPGRGRPHAWKVPGNDVVGVSPDGRLVLTYTQLRRRQELAVHPGRLVVRHARTGRTVRTFAGFPTSSYLDTAVWEGNRRILAPVHGASVEDRMSMALMRLRVGDGAATVAPLWDDPAFGQQPSVLPVLR